MPVLNRKDEKLYLKLLSDSTKKMMQQAKDGQEYATFLQELQKLENMIAEVSRKNTMGVVPPMDQEEYEKISRQYHVCGNLCIASLKQMVKENTDPDIRESLQSVGRMLGQDLNALTRVDKEHLPSMTDLLYSAHSLTLDITGEEYSKVGGQMNQRIAVSYKDSEGNEVKGFFTPSAKLDVEKMYRDIAEKNGAENPKYAEKLKRFCNSKLFKDITKEGMLVEGVFKDGREENWDDWKQMIQEAGLDEELLDDETFLDLCEKTAMEIYQAYRPLQTQMQQAFIEENSNLDQRNSAMSEVANLLHCSNLLAPSENMTMLIDGKPVKGTFMKMAEGVDVLNMPKEGDPVASYSDEAYLQPEMYKSYADLQTLDWICGNIDRHMGNIIFQFDTKDEKHPKVSAFQGIDNDLSFGLISSTMNQMSDPNNMIVISEAMANTILKLEKPMLEHALLAYDLSEKEVEAAWNRVELLKNAIEKGKEYYKDETIDFKEGQLRVVKDGEWEKIDFKALKEKNISNFFFNSLLSIPETVKDNLDERKKKENDKRKECEEQGIPYQPEEKKPLKFANGIVRGELSLTELQKNKAVLDGIWESLQNAGGGKGSREYTAMYQSLEQVRALNEKILTQELEYKKNPEAKRATEMELQNLGKLFQKALDTSNTYIAQKNPYFSKGKRRLEAAGKLQALALREAKATPDMEKEAELINRQQVQYMQNMFTEALQSNVSILPPESPERSKGELAIKSQKSLFQMAQKEGVFTEKETENALKHMQVIIHYDPSLEQKMQVFKDRNPKSLNSRDIMTFLGKQFENEREKQDQRAQKQKEKNISKSVEHTQAFVK